MWLPVSPAQGLQHGPLGAERTTQREKGKMGSSWFALEWHLFLIYTANKEWKHTYIVHRVTNIWDNLPRKATEAKINELKWPLWWGEGVNLLGEVRENGRAECPVSGGPFPLLILWYVPPAITTSLSEAILLIEAPWGPVGVCMEGTLVADAWG